MSDVWKRREINKFHKHLHTSAFGPLCTRLSLWHKNIEINIFGLTFFIRYPIVHQLRWLQRLKILQNLLVFVVEHGFLTCLIICNHCGAVLH